MSNYLKKSNTFGKSSAVRQLCVIAAGRYSPRYAASRERVQMACC